MTLRIAVPIALLISFFSGASAAAQAPVGGPPTNQGERCSPPQHCGDPIVVASSDETPLPVEMVAYTSRAGLCVGLDVDADQQGAICDVQRAETDAIENLGQSFGPNVGGPNYTYTYGALRADVASLDVTYRRRGATHSGVPVIAFIRDDLQRRLGQSEPFTGFVVLAHGCVGVDRFRLTARDSSGNVLQELQPIGPAVPERRRGCNLGGPPPSTPPAPPTDPAPVGGPPTLDFKRCDRLLRPCGDPVVIGSGQSGLGPVEVVAFTTRLGLCIDVDMTNASGGGCPNDPPPSPVKVVGTAGGFDSQNGAYTQLEGTTTPEVTEVQARFRRRGTWHTSEGLIARIEGELQSRLEQPSPFGFFVVTVPGCIEAERFHVTARAADGSVLERTRGPSFAGLPDPCDGQDVEPYQGTGWSLGFGRSERPTFAWGSPSTRTMSAVKSLAPRSSAEPTP
jgi:hypothetical protein